MWLPPSVSSLKVNLDTSFISMDYHTRIGGLLPDQMASILIRFSKAILTSFVAYALGLYCLTSSPMARFYAIWFGLGASTFRFFRNMCHMISLHAICIGFCMLRSACPCILSCLLDLCIFFFQPMDHFCFRFDVLRFGGVFVFCDCVKRLACKWQSYIRVRRGSKP